MLDNALMFAGRIDITFRLARPTAAAAATAVSSSSTTENARKRMSENSQKAKVNECERMDGPFLY